MGMQEFIAKIAKGPKASKDLTWDEAKRAMRALIEGEATAAQAGAFLVAMRFKMESVTELASFTAAGQLAGPSLGGFALDISNWRGVFWAQVVLGLIAMPLAHNPIVSIFCACLNCSSTCLGPEISRATTTKPARPFTGSPLMQRWIGNVRPPRPLP